MVARITSALAVLAAVASTVSAGGLQPTYPTAGASVAYPGNITITWVYQPNIDTLAGSTDSTVVSFQLTDLRGGPNAGVTVGGPFCTAALSAQTCTAALPQVVGGSAFSLAYSTPGSTVNYYPTFAITSNATSSASGGAAPVSGASSTAAAAPTASSTSSRPTATPTTQHSGAGALNAGIIIPAAAVAAAGLLL